MHFQAESTYGIFVEGENAIKVVWGRCRVDLYSFLYFLFVGRSDLNAKFGVFWIMGRIKMSHILLLLEKRTLDH